MNEGASFTGLTVTPMVWLVLPPARLIVTVMIDMPNAFAAGLMVTIPVAPVMAALRWALSFGTRMGLSETAVTEVIELGSPGSNGTMSCVSSPVLATMSG